jgi:hypothetical protein
MIDAMRETAPVVTMWKIFLLGLAVLASVPASAQETPAPAGAKVYFINLRQGSHVSSPFLVQFGLSGMGVAPAGADFENTGHHHLLIDTAAPAKGEPIPMDDTHRHFGKGQTEAMITLPPGQHMLQMVMGDKSHFPMVPSVASEKVLVIVDK